MSRLYRLTSKLFFLWVTPFIQRNLQTALREDTLLPLPVDEMASRDYQKLHLLISQGANRSVPSLCLALCRLFVPAILKVVLLSLLLVTSSCLTPLLLRQLLIILQGDNSPIWLLFSSVVDALSLDPKRGSALTCSLLLFLSSCATALSANHLWYTQVTLGMRVKVALSYLIYVKALRLHRETRKEASSGFIINLVSTDTFKIQWFTSFLHGTWTYPLIIVVVMVILFTLVGSSVLWGGVLLVSVMTLSTFISRMQSRLRRDLSKLSDLRVGRLNEIFQHIKAVKFQAWEPQLSQRISVIRTQEVLLTRKLALLSATSSFLSASAPALALFVTLSVAIFRGIPVTAAVIFPSLTLLLVLRYALGMIPELIFYAVEAWVGISRIHRFLDLRERTTTSPSALPPGTVSASNACFMWSEDTQAFSLPQISISPGELVAVVGGVGSGKSALLLGLLGELSTRSGSVTIAGSKAYTAQTPWIVSDTIRGNILCGAPFDLDRYQRAVSASGLGSDLAALSDRDLTEIGERGINLSGGQRQRVALARALYQNADVYLFDDPLSALDPGVANQVFNNMIIKELASKTRILVTHRLEYALQADRVWVIEGGRIVEDGPPLDLERHNSRFSALLSFHAQTVGSVDPKTAMPLSDSVLVDEEPVADVSYSSTEKFIVEEERERGSVSLDVVKKFTQMFAPGAILFVLLAVFVSRNFSAISTDLWVTSHAPEATTSPVSFLATYVTLVAIICTLNFARSLLVFYRGVSTGISAHAAMITGVMKAPLRFFEANPVGRILNRFSRDIETVEILLPRAILDLLHQLFELTALLLSITIIQPVMLLFIAPMSLVYYRIQRAFRPTSRQAQRLESITRSPVLALLAESLAGLETLRSSPVAQAFEKRFERSLEVHGRATYSMTCANRWIGIRLEFLGALLFLLTAISAAFLNAGSSLPIATGFLLTYVLNFTGSINWLVRSVSQAESNLTSFERVQEYTNLPSENIAGNEPPTDWPRSGDVRLKGLTLRYREELPPAISNVSCEIRSGERVGIVGRTGSGKSTLVLGLLRLLEASEGSVEVDSVNLASIRLDAVRRAITVIPQEPVLFSGTLRDNVDPFQLHSDNEIIDALKRVELLDFVRSLPTALDSEVTEAGSNLSSGQRQLLCLARALLEKSRVIILDEATAHIDVETDVAIQHTLRREFKHATLLVIAHRLGTVLDSDRIMVLQSGRLREFDRPEDLLCQPDSALAAMVRELHARKP